VRAKLQKLHPTFIFLFRRAAGERKGHKKNENITVGKNIILEINKYNIQFN
jgi:hypothetical protein